MNTLKLKLSAAALVLGSFITVLAVGCKKEAAPADNHISKPTTAGMYRFVAGSRPGGLWYFGTPYMNGCTQPCGPYCHATPFDGVVPGGEMQEFGLAYYSLLPGNKLMIEVDVTNLNPQHLNAIITNGTFDVPVPGELPYQTIVQTYNNAGITSNIPHYEMPGGQHPVVFNNSGASVKVLTVTFVTLHNIEVTLEY